MPELYDEDVKQETLKASAQEELLMTRLFDYIKPEQNPWRADYLDTMRDCANFKELKQWDGQDAQLLESLAVPPVPVDRINRGLDTISGIRENTGSKKKVVKRELGDERVATILDKVFDHVEYSGNFGEIYDSVFENMRDYGQGIFKCGYDPESQGGTIWIDSVNAEDFWHSRCKSKTLSDISWAVHQQMTSWEDAMALNPDRAGEVKGLKTLLEAEWEKLKGEAVTGSASAQDYSNARDHSEPPYSYPEQVYLWEFWIKRRRRFLMVGYTESVQTVDPFGNINQIPAPKIRLEPDDYQLQGDEQELRKTVIDEWHQYIVASGRGQKNAILLKESVDDDHPFVGEIADRKKSGQPRGYIEIVKPHQQRINLAWAQKIASNNKAIKAPLAITGAAGTTLDAMTQTSHFGSVIVLPQGAQLAAPLNSMPQVNLQAIEEGNVARADMDFAAAATEEALRGTAQPSESGIKLSLRQNAAVTPLNKFVKSEQAAKAVLGRKILKYIIRYYKPERMARIIGDKEFLELVLGPLDPQSGQPILPPIQFPLPNDTVNYDVIVEDQSVSDFNKQQTFNAVMALKSSGVPFTDDYMIKSAPLRDVDGALESNQKARTDIINMLLQQNQMLTTMLQGAQKESKPTNQKGNAQRGRSQPQVGPQSMLGGAGPNSPLG